MPAGAGKPARGYHAGKKGSYGCSGYPTVSADGTVHGCHKTKEQAAAQARAIWASVNSQKADSVPLEDFMLAEDASDISKADTFSPNAGMKAAARRALKWKEEGKATGAGTPVGWGRATDIVAGRSLSLDVVTRMYSFFSRHEVDKKGKDFNNTANPSNGRIMWDAWGGDAGFAWSRAIVNRMKDKALFADFGKDFTRAESLDTVFKSNDMNGHGAGHDGEHQCDCQDGMCPEGCSQDTMKRERSMATRERLAQTGQAMADGSYPIVTVQDLRNAIQAFGRASNPQATKEHIMRRARALGRTDLIPDNWK